MAECLADTCAETTNKPVKWLRAGDRALRSVIRRSDDKNDFESTPSKTLALELLTRINGKPKATSRFRAPEQQRVLRLIGAISPG